jgi:putative transposase
MQQGRGRLSRPSTSRVWLSSWWPRPVRRELTWSARVGLLSRLTKRVLETALEAEMTDHLGYDKHDPTGRNRGNSRNGVRSKTVLTDIGPVEIDVPRDVDSSFAPTIVKKRQRRLTGVDQIVLSLSARGLTTGEISAHFAEVYGASVSRETVSKITDQVLEEMTAWMNRPLDEEQVLVNVVNGLGEPVLS